VRNGGRIDMRTLLSGIYIVKISGRNGSVNVALRVLKR
jgi:hypothetical protein